MATITFDESHKTVLRVKAEKNEVVEIPEGVTTLGEFCFFDCLGISVVIPSSVTSIDYSAFSNSSFTSIVVKSGNKIYDSRNNCNALIETATNKMIRGCENTIIPKGVTSLEDECFIGCKRLSSIIIPEGVTSLGNCCFAGCSNLTKIIIPDSVKKITSDCFVGCDSLKDLEIPKGCEYEAFVGLGEL